MNEVDTVRYEDKIGSLRGLTTTVAGLFAVVVLLALAWWLRWQYVTRVGLFVDEFTTLWAVRRTLETGAPLMPSGVLYTRGILATYLTAAVAAVGGLTPVVGRLPSLFFGLATVLATFYAGRREWNVYVGWLAATGLVLLPEAIEASARARFYAQLMFFVLLTIWFAYVAVQTRGSERFRDVISQHALLLFTISFILALFSHAETVVLYPSLLLAMMLWRGRRYFVQRNVLLAHLTCVTAIGLRYWLERFGQPGHLGSMLAHKPYVSLSLEVASAWGEYYGLFVGGRRLPLTVFAIVAVIVALAGLRRRRGRLLQLPRFHQATLFFAIQFCFVLLVLLTVGAESWREDRYVYMVETCWLLAAAAGVVLVVNRIVTYRAVQPAAIGVVTVLVAGLMWPLTVAVLHIQPDGYERTLRYVSAQRRPGDVVMSPQPPACALVLGESCDYYPRHDGYEPYVVPQDGVLVDRWSGAQLLSSNDELERVLRSEPRVWFVTDGHRLGARYESDFLRTVVEQFDVEFEERNVRALLAEGWRDPPPYAVERSFDEPIAFGLLSLMGWERSEIVPGQPLHVMLHWKETGFIPRQINTSVQVAADGARPTQADGPPARGMISTFERPHVVVPDPKTLSLPADLPMGRYRLELVAYDAGTLTPIEDPLVLEWFRVGPPPTPPDHDVGATWENGLTLVGHDGVPPTLSPDLPLTLRLVWTTTDRISRDYTTFLHLLGPDGDIVTQRDREPENGFYPTSAWATDDRIEESYSLDLPTDVPAGEYQLLVGWYDPQTGERPLLENGADAFEIGRWSVE